MSFWILAVAFISLYLLKIRLNHARAKAFDSSHTYKIIYNLNEQFSWSTPLLRASINLRDENIFISKSNGLIEIPYSNIELVRCQFGEKNNLIGHTILIEWKGEKIYLACLRWGFWKIAIFNALETIGLFEQLKKKNTRR